MNDELEQLADAIRQRPVPEGFPDRVMDALPTRSRWQRCFDAPLVQAALWTAASILLAVRVGAVVAMLLPV